MIFSQHDRCSSIKLNIKMKAWQSIQKKVDKQILSFKRGSSS